MIGVAANALSWLGNFKGPCLILAAVAFVGGGVTAGSVSYLATKGLYAGKLADQRVRLERIEKQNLQARADTLERSAKAADEIRRDSDVKREELAALRTDIRGLRRDVSVCASYSNMQVSEPTGRTDAAVASGQPRPAADVLQDLAEQFATRADDAAVIHNGLIEWFRKVQHGQ